MSSHRHRQPRGSRQSDQGSSDRVRRPARSSARRSTLTESSPQVIRLRSIIKDAEALQQSCDVMQEAFNMCDPQQQSEMLLDLQQAREQAVRGSIAAAQATMHYSDAAEYIHQQNQQNSGVADQGSSAGDASAPDGSQGYGQQPYYYGQASQTADQVSQEAPLDPNDPYGQYSQYSQYDPQGYPDNGPGGSGGYYYRQ